MSILKIIIAVTILFTNLPGQNLMHIGEPGFENTWQAMQPPLGRNISWNQTQTDSNTTVIGRWEHGPCYAVEVEGDIAYFGNGGS